MIEFPREIVTFSKGVSINHVDGILDIFDLPLIVILGCLNFPLGLYKIHSLQYFSLHTLESP